MELHVVTELRNTIFRVIRMKRTRRRKSENVRSYSSPRTVSRCYFKSKCRCWRICIRSKKLSSDESEWIFDASVRTWRRNSPGLVLAMAVFALVGF